jgi:hypothetical protein
VTKQVSRAVLSIVSLHGLATCQGCSYLSVQAIPAAFDRRSAIHCTTNRAAPVIDTLFTATNLASTVYVATQDQGPHTGAAVGLGLAAAGLWMSSAIYGYQKTSECEALLAERDDDEPFRPANYRVIVPGERTSATAPISREPSPPATPPPAKSAP